MYDWWSFHMYATFYRNVMREKIMLGKTGRFGNTVHKTHPIIINMLYYVVLCCIMWYSIVPKLSARDNNV